MKLEANLTGDVSLLKQTLVVDGHLVVDLPHNPYPIIKCLRDGHDDGCSPRDHVDVPDADFEVRFE